MTYRAACCFLLNFDFRRRENGRVLFGGKAGRSIFVGAPSFMPQRAARGGLAGTLPMNLTTLGSLEGALAKVPSTPSITGCKVT